MDFYKLLCFLCILIDLEGGGVTPASWWKEASHARQIGGRKRETCGKLVYRFQWIFGDFDGFSFFICYMLIDFEGLL